MSYKNILVSDADAIRNITINRPDKLNALNGETIKELSDCFKNSEQNTSIKAIILTGIGKKSFVAGADISEFYKFGIEGGKKLSKQGHTILFDLIENLTTPVIAAINGFALGGGLELAMACHIRVASDNARMGLPEVTLGVIPGYGGTQRLAQLVGKGNALEMIMTADMIKADKALKLRLVNYVETPEELMNRCNAIALKIVKNSPVAIKSAIRAINAGFKDGTNGFETEIEQFGICFGTEDFKEGTTAFMEKRKAVFPGN